MRIKLRRRIAGTPIVALLPLFSFFPISYLMMIGIPSPLAGYFLIPAAIACTWALINSMRYRNKERGIKEFLRDRYPSLGDNVTLKDVERAIRTYRHFDDAALPPRVRSEAMTPRYTAIAAHIASEADRISDAKDRSLALDAVTELYNVWAAHQMDWEFEEQHWREKGDEALNFLIPPQAAETNVDAEEHTT